MKLYPFQQDFWPTIAAFAKGIEELEAELRAKRLIEDAEISSEAHTGV